MSYTETEIHDARHELEDLMEWMSANDYKVNKYVLGEYTDASPSWVAYKAERATKVARIREIEQTLPLEETS